ASSLALIAGASSLREQIESERQPLFFSAWLLALAGMCGILVSADAFNIFVFMEISSLASYVLVAGGPDRRALPAVFKYLTMGTIGATFYLIGVGLIYLMTGTLNLEDMELRIHEVADQRPILVAAGFITVGLALKAAIFPLHVWLPNAYTYAPHVVTVFLAACATKVALYVLLRFDLFVFQPNLAGHDLQFAYFLMPLSLLAILIASAVAMFELDLKRLLAWSSVAQIGYITLGASLASKAGLTASLLHVFNHALAKSALFLACACLAMSVAKLRVDSIGGAARQMPWTMAAFVLAGLSLIGVPGTAGFISKWYLISATFASGMTGILLVAVIVVSSLMAVVYIWRVVESAYFGVATNDQAITEAPLALLVPTWVAVLLNLYFGLFPDIPLQLSSTAAETLLWHQP
ncbi:MAG: proton-conducting transporter membrane subunit, partial [Gammaproteobacteria bacterium]